MIEIHGLSKHFGPFAAVDGIDLTVPGGEVLGFLGPNGAGKTTTMRMITGFLAPSAGSITIAGFDVAAAPLQARQVLGYLPEGAPLYPDMTVAGFLGFIAEVRRIDGQRRRERLDAVIDQVGLGDVLRQPIGTLSKGYKRRVGLAQAIVHEPRVLILDEPTDGLDPNQKHEVRKLIRAMARDRAIVISTHILEEVEAVCSRAVIIDRGRIIADGTPDELKARSGYHNAVVLTVPRAQAGAATEDLKDLPGVERVTRDELADGYDRYTVIPTESVSIAGAVSGLVRERGWSVRELYVLPGRLDDVFRKLTGHRQSGEAA
ncbi:ABC transporter ATP-binding protein [Oceanibacterium hippocampi]|uniref:ABC transporter ATP-binding protein n=1 Tax=Oceanibacterium hippocampi TaxID=745714 RepID=UPI000A26CD1C